jgi:hypothetical protein
MARHARLQIALQTKSERTLSSDDLRAVQINVKGVAEDQRAAELTSEGLKPLE